MIKEGVTEQAEVIVRETNKGDINFGNVYGVCDKYIGTRESNTRIYEIKPLIPGKYGMPIRVTTTVFLKAGTVYSIKGALDTFLIDDLAVPVLSASMITQVNTGETLMTHKSDDLSRVLFASFIYTSSLTVINKTQLPQGVIVSLKKITRDSKYLNVVELVAITTPSTHNAFDGIQVGDTVDIFGTIHRDREYDDCTKKYEVGVKILKVNPTKRFVDSLEKSIKVLHATHGRRKFYERVNKEYNNLIY